MHLNFIKSSFHKGKNLISFFLAEMVIFHDNLKQVKKLWILIHLQPLKVLANVALRI